MKILLVLLCVISIATGEPSPVGQFKVSDSGVDYFAVSWVPSADDIQRYEIEYERYPQTRENTRKEIGAQSQGFNITEGIVSGTTYQVRIRAVAKDNSASLWGAYQLIPTMGPLPPSGMKITDIVDTTALVTFLRSTDTKVVKHQVMYRENKQGQAARYIWVPLSASTSVHITDLTADTPYEIKLSAWTEDNQRSSYLKSGLRTGPALPTKPLNTYVSNIGDTSATLHWSDQQKEAMYEVEVYKAADNQKVMMKTISSRELHVTSLEVGVFYKWRVRAVVQTNKGHWSQWFSFQTKPIDVPGASSDLALVDITNSAATLQWTSQTSVLRLSHYIIELAVFLRPPTEVRVSGTATSYSFSKLKSGTKYSYRLRAFNKNQAAGAWTTKRLFETLGPKPVTSISITELGDSSAKVSWTTLDNQKYANVVLTLYDNSHATTPVSVKQLTFSNTTTMHVLRDLKPVNPYFVHVLLKTDQGALSSVEENGFRTDVPRAALNALLNPDVKKISSSSAEFSCDKLASMVVQKYEVRVQGYPNPRIPINVTYDFPPSMEVSTRQTMRVGDLVSGHQLMFDARATLAKGVHGQWSTKQPLMLPGGRPPVYVSVEQITDIGAVVTWIPGYTDSDGDDVVYFVKIKGTKGEKNEWLDKTYQVARGQLSFKIPEELLPSTGHSVKVFAQKNGVNGTSAKSGFRTGLSAPRPAYYPDIHYEVGKTTFTWQGISERTDIIYYELLLIYGVPKETYRQTFRTKNAQQTSWTFSGLAEGMLYSVVVRAVVSDAPLYNSKGAWSTSQLFTPRVLLKAPTELTVSDLKSFSAKLSWKSAIEPELSASVFRYEVELDKTDHRTQISQFTLGIQTSIRLESLVAGTRYDYRVRAIGYSGNVGEWSNRGSFTTAGKAGQAPSSTPDSNNTAATVGIVIAVIALLALIVIGVLIYRRRYRANKFQEFNANMSYTKDKGYTNGDAPTSQTEMEDTGTAIKQGNKLYL